MFLVVIETQRVKSFLFASRILRETRGASLLLDRLNREETRQMVRSLGGEEIYLGGGSGRVIFQDRGPAEQFVRELRELYRKDARDARVSVELVERGAGEELFRWMYRGVQASRQSKRAPLEAIPLIGGRWIRPCTSCGQRPADSLPLRDVQGEHQICTSCRQKREEIQTLYGAKGSLDRRLPVPRAEWWSRSRPGSVLSTLVERVERDFDGARVLLPRDFEDIGERSRPRSYFAFIYADGNRMGETIRSLPGRFPDDEAAKRTAFQAFSEIVDQATREAAVEAVLSEVGAFEEKTADGEAARLVPAEFVVAGGDDLILVVPAHAGLAVASRFLSLFNERSLALQRERFGGRVPLDENGFTISAGVVLAHASYPASQLVELAVDLMKNAKRAVDPKAPEGTVDFMVLNAPGSERLKERRKEYVQRLPSGAPVHLTERPYTGKEIRELCDSIRALKGSSVPRSKLKSLYSVLFRPPVEAQFAALRIKERLKATGDLQDGPESAALAALTGLDRFPFRETPMGWSTPLTELIEIFDFIPGETRDA